MSGLSRLLTSLSVQCEVRVRHGMPKGQRVFSTLEDLDAPILLKPWIRMFMQRTGTSRIETNPTTLVASSNQQSPRSSQRVVVHHCLSSTSTVPYQTVHYYYASQSPWYLRAEIHNNLPGRLQNWTSWTRAASQLSRRQAYEYGDGR